MSVTLSAAMAAASTAMGSVPGWLVQIGDSTRIASLGDVTAMGLTWLGADIEISGLTQGGNLSSGGRIVIADPDLAWASLHLNGQLNGQACKVWSVDASALAAGDPVLEFTGSLAQSAHQPERCTVTARLAPNRAAAPMTPRMKIGPATGTTIQLPPGSVLRVGNTSIVVEDPRL
ncbi:MAG: hypothetical protein KDH15_04650 [Rhodocyclaceae bacterium]|nr:hypothetical protein [Rhodocyclaceae bacterium]